MQSCWEHVFSSCTCGRLPQRTDLDTLCWLQRIPDAFEALEVKTERAADERVGLSASAARSSFFSSRAARRVVGAKLQEHRHII